MVEPPHATQVGSAQDGYIKSYLGGGGCHWMVTISGMDQDRSDTGKDVSH